ncbi:MAG: LLM class F420-dependent oxidoreductase [Thermoleophilia bacterium]|nr:LLM class F420-dependent oxidoreductase [Thermoleophilia bacterium]
MKLGVHVGYVVNRDLLFEQLKTVQAAEELGYDSVWTAEAYGSDAATPLAWFASQTSRIKLGSAIFQIPGRTPGNCAMTATTLDCLSDGRFILGLGSSGPQVAEGWHGQPFARQIQRTREYIEILRKMLGRERAEYDGEIYKLPLPDGLGKPLKIMLPPVQQRIPIYLAAIGPNNTALAGELADGWLPYLYAPEHAAGLNKNLAQGAARAGRTTDDIAISPSVFAATGDGDIAELRDLIRPILALYIGGMGARDKNFYNQLVCSYGFEEQAKKVQDLYLDKQYAEAAVAVPAELIDMVSLVGTKAQVAERIAAFKEVGVDNLLVVPMAADTAGRHAILETVAEAAV